MKLSEVKDLFDLMTYARQERLRLHFNYDGPCPCCHQARDEVIISDGEGSELGVGHDWHAALRDYRSSLAEGGIVSD